MDILRHDFFAPKCHIEYFLKNIRTNLGFPLFYHQQTKFREGNIFTGVCLSGGGVGTLHASWDRSHGRLPPSPPQTSDRGITPPPKAPDLGTSPQTSDLGTYPLPVVTSSGGHRKTYGWQVDGTHPIRMLSCS